MADGYTLQQLQAMGAQPVASPQPQQQPGFTLAQLQAMGAQPTSVAQPKPVEPISQIPTQIKKRGAAVYGDITGTSAESQGENPLVRGLQASGEAAGAVGDVAGGILGSIIHHVVPQAVQTFVGQKVAAASQQMESDTGTGMNQNLYLALGEKLNQWAGGHPEAAKALESTLKATSGTGNVAMNIVGADVGGGAAEGAVQAAPKVADTALAPVRAVGRGVDAIQSAVTNPLKEFGVGISSPEEAVNAISEDWAKNGQKYKTTSAMLAKNPDTARILGELKLDPQTMIEDGKFNTTEEEQYVRSHAAQLSREQLRPALEKYDPVTPKADLDEIRNNAVAAVRAAHEGDALDVRAQVKRIEDNIAEMKVAASEAGKSSVEAHKVGLVESHDAKIRYSQEGGYRHDGRTPDDNNRAISNRYLAKAFQHDVERRAPKDVPVKEANAALSQYYKAADFLKQMHFKTPVVTLKQKIARSIAGLGGAVVASHVAGGASIIADVAGYHTGRYIERLLEKMGKPQRDNFLREYQRKDPAAFQQLSETLRKTVLEHPELPPASAIITPAPSEEQMMRGRASQLTQSQLESPARSLSAQQTAPIKTIKSSAIPAASPKKGETSMKGKGTSNKTRK